MPTPHCQILWENITFRKGPAGWLSDISTTWILREQTNATSSSSSYLATSSFSSAASWLSTIFWFQVLKKLGKMLQPNKPLHPLFSSWLMHSFSREHKLILFLPNEPPSWLILIQKYPFTSATNMEYFVRENGRIIGNSTDTPAQMNLPSLLLCWVLREHSQLKPFYAMNSAGWLLILFQQPQINCYCLRNKVSNPSTTLWIAMETSTATISLI